MADHRANPFDEPLDNAHLTRTGVAVDSTGAAAVIRWIPTLEAFLADLQRVANTHRHPEDPAHPAHPAHTAVSTDDIADQRLHLVPAGAGSQPAGDAATSATSARRATSRNKRKRTGQRPLLTRREAEVLGLTTAGQNAAEIAEQFHLSKGTVYVHRRNARRKLRESDIPRGRTTCVTTFVPPPSHQ